MYVANFSISVVFCIYNVELVLVSVEHQKTDFLEKEGQKIIDMHFDFLSTSKK